MAVRSRPTRKPNSFHTGNFLVGGPDWNGGTPPGIKDVLRSSTEFTMAIIRTQLFGPDDM